MQQPDQVFLQKKYAVEANQLRPLSPNQRAIWFLQQTEPQSAIYNFGFVIQVHSPLDTDSLHKALQSIVDRHDVLHTHYIALNGEPLRLVRTRQEVDFEIIDAADWSNAELEYAIADTRSQSFDLANDSLLRVKLYSIAKEHYALQFVVHDIAVDGWSVWIILDELGRYYELALNEQDAKPLPQLKHNYDDFIAWQSEMLAGEKGDKLCCFWANELAGDLPRLELAADYHPAEQGFMKSSVQIKIEPKITQELRQLSLQEGGSIYSILLAAFQVLLYKYSDQPDILIGTAVHGRSKLRFSKLVGLFSNIVPMRAQIDPLGSFRSHLGKTSKYVKQVLLHQHYPSAMLPELVQSRGELTGQSLIQAGFNLLRPPRRLNDLVAISLDNRHKQPILFGGVLISGLEIDLDYGVGHADLFLNLFDIGDRLAGTINYNAGMFKEETISSMADHFYHLLNEIVAHPDDTVANLNLLLPEEQQTLLVSWNETAAPLPPNQFMHTLFEEQTTRTPRATAVVCGERELTYDELNRRANQVAHHLRGLGVGPEKIVGVAVDRSPEMIVALLGILKAGGAYLPLDPAYPSERLAFMLSETNPHVLLTQQSLLARLSLDQGEAGTTVCLDRDRHDIAKQSEQNPGDLMGPENLAYIIYTSGSTGQPKGVMIPHHAVLNLSLAVIDQFQLSPRDRVLQFMTINFDAAVEEIFPTLSSGASLIMRGPDILPVDSLNRFISREELTVLHLPAAYWVEWVNELAASEIHPPGCLRVVAVGGEKVDSAKYHQWHQIVTGQSITWLNAYGPTEATVLSTLYRASDQVMHEIPIGRPIANTTTYILDRNRQPVPIGVAGELYIGGTGLARGYLNRPDLTAEHFITNPFVAKATEGESLRLYKTGDLARYLADGNIEYLGRTDYQVKIRGFRIEPGEVESALLQHPGVDQAIVASYTNDVDHKQLIAYLVSEEELPPPADEIRRFLQQHLPDYMIPSAFIMLDSIPLTESGKIDRKALSALDIPRPDLTQSYVKPRTPQEKMLVDIWAQVLQVDQVGIYDNFFDLGGHSLLATQVASRIVQASGVALSLRTLFNTPTIAALSSVLDQARRTSPITALPMRRVTRDKPIPLSFAQERMWFLHQLAPNDHAYHIPITMQYQQAINQNALQKAIEDLVMRHESLRTIFPARGGVPRQEIVAPKSFAINEIDLSSLPPAKQEMIVTQLVQAEIALPFELANEPPWRFTLFRLNDELYVLHFAFHHIIFDQWSAAVLWQELNALYQAYLQDESPALPPLEIQYIDFSVWQRDWLQGPVLAALLDYWRNQLAGVSSLNLPTDHTRPLVLTYKGATETLPLSPALVDALRACSRRWQVSPFMLMLAVFKMLLSRYAGQTDIAVGVPVANRQYLAIESTIGVFVNILVVRSDVDGSLTFAQLLERVRDNLLDAYAHQELPFEKLVSEIVQKRDRSHAPLVQVLFNMANAPFDHKSAADSPISFMAFDRGAAQFDLSVSVVLEEQLPVEPQITVEYNTMLYERKTVQQFLAHFEALLAAVVLDAHKPISSYEILTTAEQRLLVTDWNKTQMATPRRCLHELFAEQARRTPANIAVVFENQSLTYTELDQRSNQLARYLQNRGIAQDSVVGVFIERSLEMVVGLLGILKAGGAYLPLDPGFPAQRLAFMVEDAQVNIVLTQAYLVDISPGQDIAHAVCLDSDWPQISQFSSDPLPATADSDDCAYTIYTSGSTGKPKGVQITHRNVVNFLTAMLHKPGLAAGDRLLAVTTLSFDISVLELFLPLINGASVVVAKREVANDGRLLAKLIEDSRATVLQATPATWTMLLASDWRGCHILRALCGGEAMPRELAEQLLPRVAELWNMYGPTETTVWSTIYPVTAVTNQIPIGRPIANTQIYILDQHMHLVPVGVSGELYIGGLGVCHSYLNRPGLTAERFVPDPFSDDPDARLFKTGDAARYLPDGNIAHIGRLDHQVKIRGFRIELGEIEAVLDQHSAVAQSVAVVQEDEVGDKRIVACYIPDGEERPAANILRAHLSERLPAYMVPSLFIELDAFPLTPNRKVDRQALPQPERLRPHLETDFVLATSNTEQILVEIWRDLLKMDKVGIRDNFFELGGHSLLAVQLFARIERSFGVSLSLTSLFGEATIENLASLISKQSLVQGWSSLVAITTKEDLDKPNFFAVHGLTGDVYWFESLAHHMGSDQPIYGLQSCGLDGVQEPLSTFEEMAAHYINEIRGLQPDGPYFIGGYSLGGNIAYEMARQLEQQGHEVALLAIIDHMPANSDYFKFTWNPKFIGNLLRNLPYRLQDFLLLSPNEILIRIQRKFRSARRGMQHRLQGDSEDEQLQVEAFDLIDNADLFPAQMQRVIESNSRAWRGYQPQTYSGHVTLLRARGGRLFCSHDPEMGWGRLAGKGVTIHEIPGSHLRIFREPYIQCLASNLRRCIEQAQRADEQKPGVQ